MFDSMRRALSGMWLLVAALLLVSCGGGESTDGGPPAAVIHSSALSIGTASAETMTVPLGSAITLDGSASSSQGGITAYVWSIGARPAGSTAQLKDASSAVASFVPDVAGNYEFILNVGSGRYLASAALPVTVTAAVPVVNVNSSVSFAGPVTMTPPEMISLGSVIAMDASTSTDAAGGPVTIAYSLRSAPTGSSAALAVDAGSARLTPDLAGTYQVAVRATSISGLYAETVHTFDVAANAPTVVVATSVSTVGSSSSLAAAVGNLVALDGALSRVPGGNGVGTWTILNKPAASGLTQLTSTSATAVNFVPDAAGSYLLQYTVVDKTTGAASFSRISVNVVVGPTAVVSSTASPVAQVGGPSYVGAVGAPITLHGDGSYDATGDALTYSWVLDTRPAGSTAALTGASTANPTFTPDKDGRYGATLTVTNKSGLRASAALTAYVGKYPPVVVLDRTQNLLLLGNVATASAANSYSQNGGTLSYVWSLDTRPVGSAASIATPNTPTLSFTPDLAGTYYASVTVTDGGVNAISGVTVTAVASSAGTVPLTYKPLLPKFSKSLNKVVIVSTNPNQLHLVDPTAATDTAVTLPTAVKAISLSADGSLAGVLHEGSVSLIDLAKAQLIRTTSTGGSQTEVFTANSGIVYVTGQTGGQWVSPAIVVINGRTGATLASGGGYGNIYGITRGVMSESLGRIFTLSEGLSPSQIYWTGVTPSTGAFTGSNGQSPYWGDYAMVNPMWLSSDNGLLITSAGTYYNTSTLSYGGTLGSAMLSVSHSSSAAELLGLASNSTYASGATQYPGVIKRYTGSLLIAQTDVPMPLLSGQQAYGIAVFHDVSDKRVMVAQTGSNLIQASGVQYFVLLR
jgi:hypothetical protein